MNYCEIKNCDIANGIGVRVTLFVSGCRNRCKGCFQPETWDFSYGKPFDSAVEDKIISMMKPNYIRGLTILGGEPFEPENQEAIASFLEKVRSAYPSKDVWVFTGFTWEELHSDSCRACVDATEKMLSLIDILVDGRFVEEKKNIRLRFRGSENQRIIDLKKSLKLDKVILWDK